MRATRRCVSFSTAVFLAGLAAAIAAQSAAATQQAARYIASGYYQGSRATITNPAPSQMTTNYGDWELSSAYADDEVDNLIQVGVTSEYKDPEYYNCNLGSPGEALYYFSEVEVNGGYTCFNEGLASPSAAYLESVSYYAPYHTWYAHRNGIGDGTSTSWTDCNGGEACRVAAFGEEDKYTTGYWWANFAGPGNTEWQYYDGSQWNNITSTPPPILDGGWSKSGSFPGGVWSLVYSQ